VFVNLGDAGYIDFSGDDGADAFTNPAGRLEGTNIVDGGADADVFINLGDAGFIDFSGDDGADAFTNGAGGVVTGTIIVDGGADADFFTNLGDAGSIDFTGDDGADTFVNFGSTGTIDFSGDDGADVFINDTAGTVGGAIIVDGGADADVFVNLGDAGSIDFSGDDGADVFLNDASGRAGGAIIVDGGADADVLVNLGDAGSIDFSGDDGADVFVNSANEIATIDVSGGADADWFRNTGSNIGTLRFFGDASPAHPISFGEDGADVFLNLGSNIGAIIVDGGADIDAFQSNGASIGSIDFFGDDGADVFINLGSHVGTIDFTGDDGADTFTNYGNEPGSIDFTGDLGNDVMVNHGRGRVVGGVRVSTIVFLGQSNDDAFQNNGVDFASYVFLGSDGADVFQNNGSGVSGIDFTGDGGVDVFENNGSGVSGIRFAGADGADVVLNDGASTWNVSVDGGADADVFLSTGDGTWDIDFIGGDGADVFINVGDMVSGIDFTGDAAADTFINSGTGLSGVIMTGGAGGDTFRNRAAATGTHDITFFGAGSTHHPMQSGTDEGNVFVNDAAGVANIDFMGGDAADVLQNTGAGASGIYFSGGGGADVFINTGDAVTQIQIDGGADGDTVQNAGNGVSGIDFDGGAGVDLFVNDGPSTSGVLVSGGADNDSVTNRGENVVSITFLGGPGDDRFQNNGSGAGTLTMHGDDGADAFENNASAVTIEFTGNNGPDFVVNHAMGVGQILVDGGDGPDWAFNDGNSAGFIRFTGGPDGDLFTNTADSVTSIVFWGDDGSDTFVADGTAGFGSSIQADGGTGSDVLVLRGAADSVQVHGGLGSDRLLISGNGAVYLDGGSDSDTYVFYGSPQANVTIGEASLGMFDTSSDTFDFSSYSAGGIAINLGSAAAQQLNAQAGLYLTLSSPAAVENVIGSAAADLIVGTSRVNQIAGADLPAGPLPPALEYNNSEQWVLLDFDSRTNEVAAGETGEHEYSIDERNAIEANMERDYHGPSPLDPWFHVWITQDPAEIPATVFAAGNYTTIYFNQTPPFGRPGGESDELDFRNLNRASHASVQVNGLLGAVGFPAITSQNFVLLSSKIAAHELAHTLGVRHADSFGPIGYGVHTPPGSIGYKPSFPGPSAAFESFGHLIGSPATIGSDRFNDLNDLYFGEREAVKLSFNERGAVVVEPAMPHRDSSTAAPLTLARLDVPNTLSSGLNAGKQFLVTALDIVGTIELNAATSHSESDWYSFAGRAGDVINLDVYSSGLSRLSDQQNPQLHTIDSVVRVYRMNGDALEPVPYFGGVAENDDQFEPTDSSLLDLVLPADGTYFIEVDTFRRDPTDPQFDPAVPGSLLHPANTASPFHPSHPDFDSNRLAALMDSLADTDSGSYELFIYTFDTANVVPATVSDTIFDSPANDDVAFGNGNSPITFDVLANDYNAVPALTLALTSPNRGILTNHGDGTFTFDPNGEFDHLPAGESETVVIQYQITDSNEETATAAVGIRITGRNDSPNVAVSFSTATVQEGQSVTISGEFLDRDATDTVEITASIGIITQSTGSSGTWSWTFNASDGPDESQTVTIRARDASGAFAETAIELNVSNMAPEFEAGADEILEAATLPHFTRTINFSDLGDDSWTGTVDWDNGSTPEPLVIDQLNRSFVLDHAFLDSGVFRVTVTVTDDDGDSHSDTFRVFLDTTPPAPATIGSHPPGQSNSPNATFEFSNVEPGVTFQCQLDGAGFAACTSPKNYTDLLDGTHTFEVKTVDASGNESESSLFNWIVDTVKPDTTINSNPPNPSSSPAATFLFSSNEASSTFQCSLDGAAFTSCTSPATYTGLADGSHTFQLRVTDAAGNIGETLASYTWTVTAATVRSIYVLNSTLCGALTLSGNAQIGVAGNVAVNSSCSSAIVANGNARLEGATIRVVGGYQKSGNASISPQPTTGVTPTPDPLAALAAPSSSELTTRSAVNCSGNSPQTLQPGIYPSIKASGNCSITLQPGTYVIKGGGLSVSGNASFVVASGAGNSVLIYNAGSNYPNPGGSFGSISLSGNGAFDLTPASNGTHAGTVIFQARDNTKAASLSGNATLGGLKGVVYTPAAQLSISGNGAMQATLIVDNLRMSGNAASSLSAGTAAPSGDAQAILAAGQLRTGVLWVSIQDPDGTMTADQLARIRDSLAQINATFGPYGVSLVEVDAAGADGAEIRISVGDTSACGSLFDGILGCTTVFGDITLIDGWDWYAGSDAAGIGSQQFDFQTIVTHEVGHSVGAEHSADSQSAMYTSLTRGVARRGFTSQDLALLEEAGGEEGDSSLTAALRAGVASGRGLRGGACPICGQLHGSHGGTALAGNRSIVFSSTRETEPAGSLAGGTNLPSSLIDNELVRGGLARRAHERTHDSSNFVSGLAGGRTILVDLKLFRQAQTATAIDHLLDALDRDLDELTSPGALEMKISGQ
jgi:hypothetical protein